MVDQTKVPIAPRRAIVLIIVAVVVMSMLYIGLAFMIRTTLPNAFSPIPAKSLAIWRIAGIVISLYTVSTPWRWQKKFGVRIVRTGRPTRAGTGMMLLFYVTLGAPMMYGLVLTLWGMPLIEYAYFAAISIGAALAWGIPNYRMAS